MAPQEGSKLTGTSGRHGGNMDTRVIIAGTWLYLSVIHPGELLAIGDLHALMDVGEISVCGMEQPEK